MTQSLAFPQLMTNWTVPILFLAGAAAVLVGLLFIVVSKGPSAADHGRNGYSREEFIRDVAAYGFDAAVSATTYDYLQKHENIQFPILPDDVLDTDLGINDEELDEVVQHLLEVSGREYQPEIFTKSPVTVMDLMRVLQKSTVSEGDLAA